MKPPEGFPKTCPHPSGSVLKLGIAAKKVSLVPSEITATPGLSAPVPTSDAGLSPVNGAIGMPGLSPYLAKYPARRKPQLPSYTQGSFSTSLGATKSHISRSHSPLPRSRRFIPAPSPVSTGASAPARMEQRNELTRCILFVAAYAVGSSFANFIIWGPVNRSIAGEPVRRRSASQNRASSAATSACVEESIQIGATDLENAPSSRSTSVRPSDGSESDASAADHPSPRYTLPCCWPSPPMASIFDVSKESASF